MCIYIYTYTHTHLSMYIYECVFMFLFGLGSRILGASEIPLTLPRGGRAYPPVAAGATAWLRVLGFRV